MKVAFVNTLYAPHKVGGAELAVQILAEGLAARGHQVRVITLAGPAAERTSVVNGVAVHRLPLANWYWPYAGPMAGALARAAWHAVDLHNPAMAARVADLLDAEPPDVLHTNNLAGFSVAVWGQAARRGVPIVHTMHDYYLMCPPSVMHRKVTNCGAICARCAPFAAYRRKAAAAVGAVAGVSQYILERHLNAGFFRQTRKARVIFNTVRPAAGEAGAARPDGPLTFGFMGRLCEGKGVAWLLETFAQTAAPGERLVLAGKGDPAYVAALKARFASPAVSFIGHVEPEVFHRQVDVVIVPSLWNEPFGRTAIEALASRLPVIVSNRGGLPEIIRHGVSGLVVDPGLQGSLARAMRRFSAEPALARRLRVHAAARLGRFSEESALQAYENLYADACRHARLSAHAPVVA
jgi:glycosyltransferase involved in cell wall biosynthesis